MAIGHRRLVEASSAQAQARAFAADVLAGLSGAPKSIPCKYLYDAEGSRIIQAIMDLPEYYPTRCEAELLERHRAEIAAAAGAGPLRLVDLGAGDGRKTAILIEHFLGERRDFAFYSIDISEAASRGLALELSRRFPALEGATLIAEYGAGLAWLAQHGVGRRLVLFLGSNIGNLDGAQARALLRDLWLALEDGDLLLLGYDLRKEVELLRAAYDDAAGVTARFNLNLLARINRELGGEFDVDSFRFYSTWEPRTSAVESYLLSTRAQTVAVRALGRSFEFAPWEPIHTESSRKYALADMEALAAETGFAVAQTFLDEKSWFADGLWRVRKAARGAPRPAAREAVRADG